MWGWSDTRHLFTPVTCQVWREMSWWGEKRYHCTYVCIYLCDSVLNCRVESRFHRRESLADKRRAQALERDKEWGLIFPEKPEEAAWYRSQNKSYVTCSRTSQGSKLKYLGRTSLPLMQVCPAVCEPACNMINMVFWKCKW